MPPRGFKTITLPRDIVDSLKEEWEKRRSHLRKKGVRSFSGFLAMVFYEYIEERRRGPAPKENKHRSLEKVVQVGRWAQASGT